MYVCPGAESVAGTVHPGGLCEAQYYGLSSAPHGKLQSPASAHLFWNVEGPLKCRHQFIPAANQSITITVSNNYCNLNLIKLRLTYPHICII